MKPSLIPKQYYTAIMFVFAVLISAAAAYVFFWRPIISNFRNSTPYAIQAGNPLSQTKNWVTLRVAFGAQNEGQNYKIPILMYHHIGDVPAHADAIRRDLTVSEETFSEQVKWLKDNGYESVSLQDLLLFAQGKTSLPPKPVIFTFDDGYEDAFQNAIPILRQYGFVGSFGVITNYPGQTQGTNIYASWDEIFAARRQGMEIVCHTQNHFDGSDKKFASDYIYNNLNGCQKNLATHLGQAEPVLIYPFGHYTASYIVQAQKAGFKMALTTHQGQLNSLNNLMQIPRVRVHGNEDLEQFKKTILAGE
ncbi:MAG: polysaccharide deacetylase family protein [Patescibacteria group bacterium]|nr:polysaccharide deacetylase family protein [Patescibacteria group bacterium]